MTKIPRSIRNKFNREIVHGGAILAVVAVAAWAVELYKKIPKWWSFSTQLVLHSNIITQQSSIERNNYGMDNTDNACGMDYQRSHRKLGEKTQIVNSK